MFYRQETFSWTDEKDFKGSKLVWRELELVAWHGITGFYNV